MALSKLPESDEEEEEEEDEEHSSHHHHHHPGSEGSVSGSSYPPSTPDRLSPAPDAIGDVLQDDSRYSRSSQGRVPRKNADIRIRVAELSSALSPSTAPQPQLPVTDPLPTEWWKTAMAFLWAGFNLFSTTIMITVVHERVPDKLTNPPLPDKFFDYVPRVEWAFTVTEVSGMVLTAVWFIQWLFLKHKSIVGRRFFFLVGLLYMYRNITMYITTLPVPSLHITCAPKLEDDTTGKLYRIWQLISGGGLSITGSHVMCGDFLYSGHTVMLTLTFLFIREYSPRSLWWFHMLCWLLSVMGAVFILVAHEHYSVDVVVAYYITSSLFYTYHTMANNESLRNSHHNYLKRMWWNVFFRLMEKNVRRPVPCTFACPLPLPSSIFKKRCKRYSKVQSPQEE